MQMQSLLFLDKTQRENDTDSKNPDGVTQKQHQSLSVPLTQQCFNRTHLSTDSNTPKDITDDISLTLTHTSEQNINNVDNSSDISESQSIDINSINFNNHVCNDCESVSGSENIATRVRAKNAKARQKEIHKIHNILRLGIEITRLFLSHFHTNINPKGSSLLWM